MFLAGIGAVLLAATLVAFPETSPRANRTMGGFAQTAHDFRILLRNDLFQAGNDLRVQYAVERLGA